MKKILTYTSILTLLSTCCYSEMTLERKIKEVDEKIRKEEQAHLKNDESLKKLVAEYNKLVQEQAASEEENPETTPIDAEHLEQNHEDAVIHRLKEHEQRIDVLERRLEKTEKQLEVLTGIKNTPTPSADNAQNTTSTAIIASSSQSTIQETTTPETQPVARTTTEATTTVKVPLSQKYAQDNLATEQMSTATTPVLNSPAIAQFNQAMSLLKSNTPDDLKKAAEAFYTITQTYPEEVYSDKAYARAAEAYQRLGNIDEAQKYYKIAITKPLDRQNAIRARLGYGETLLLKNNKQDACAQIRVLSSERLDEKQKKRFNALKISSSCPS